MPTDTGDIVNKFLTEHFAQYVDYHFTAKLEDQLDEIADGKRRWIPVMDKFWKPFIKQVEEKRASNAPNSLRRNLTKPARNAANTNCKSSSAKWAVSLRVPVIPSAVTPATSTKPPKKLPNASPKRKPNRSNSTVANAPNAADGWCTNTAAPAVNSSVAPTTPNANTSSRWKTQRYRRPMPAMQKGNLVERKSRYGKLFYSCSTYPDCNYAINPPVAEECPNCHW